MGPAFPDFLRRLFLCQAKVLHQPFIGHAFFNSIQVLALQVLDESNFCRFIGRIASYDSRHCFQATAFGRPQPPLPGNELISAGTGLLDKPMLTDGIR